MISFQFRYINGISINLFNKIFNKFFIQFWYNYFYGILNDYFIQFSFKKYNTTALHIAVSKGNVEIVQLLLGHSGIDVNIKSILKLIFWISFKIKDFNSISNQKI